MFLGTKDPTERHSSCAVAAAPNQRSFILANLCILNYVQEDLQHYNHVAMTLRLTLLRDLEWDGPMTRLC
jgi:hypothetical protein